jgi:hypothetical protein
MRACVNGKWHDLEMQDFEAFPFNKEYRVHKFYEVQTYRKKFAIDAICIEDKVWWPDDEPKVVLLRFISTDVFDFNIFNFHRPRQNEDKIYDDLKNLLKKSTVYVSKIATHHYHVRKRSKLYARQTGKIEDSKQKPKLKQKTKTI